MGKIFTYTHHQGGEGKMVEKAIMQKPECWEWTAIKDEPCTKCSAYRKHIDSLISYPARNFSPSDNGKTYGEDQFEVVNGVARPKKKLTLQKIREERNLSIEQVEKGANLPHNSLIGIESGKHISCNGIYKLCGFYEIEFSKEIMVEYRILKPSALPLSEKREERTQDELWDEVLNAAGFGFVNRHKFIEALKERYSITLK